MLVWINGAFGAGKTQTAHELHRRLPDAHVADPEPVGFALRKMLPHRQHDDVQDLPQWRASVIATLRQAEAAHDGPVIVPMSIVDERLLRRDRRPPSTRWSRRSRRTPG